MIHIIDCLINKKTGKIFAEIDVINNSYSKFLFTGKILNNYFRLEYLEAVSEFKAMVEELTFSLSDDIERKFYYYDVVLKELDMHVHQVEINQDYISFLIRYPTGNGFLNDYPGFDTLK